MKGSESDTRSGVAVQRRAVREGTQAWDALLQDPHPSIIPAMSLVVYDDDLRMLDRNNRLYGIAFNVSG